MQPFSEKSSENHIGNTHLFPNPNDVQIMISIEKGKISNLFDSYGRRISFDLPGIHSTKYEVRLT
jgi:hypothetical protein